MHIPLWLWFRSDAPIEQKLVRDERGYVPTGTAHDTVISISDPMQRNHPDSKQGDTRLALDRPLRAIGDGGRSSALIGSFGVLAITIVCALITAVLVVLRR